MGDLRRKIFTLSLNPNLGSMAADEKDGASTRRAMGSHAREKRNKLPEKQKAGRWQEKIGIWCPNPGHHGAKIVVRVGPTIFPPPRLSEIHRILPGISQNAHQRPEVCRETTKDARKTNAHVPVCLCARRPGLIFFLWATESRFDSP